MRKTLDWATEVALILSMLLLAMLVATFLYEVASRYFFNQPQQWPSNLEPALFCTSMFLALPAVTRCGEHISIDILPGALPPVWQRRAKVMLLLFAALVCLTATYVCGSEVAKQFIAKTSTYGSLPYPKWWVSISIPTGFGLTAIQFVYSAFDVVAHRESEPK